MKLTITTMDESQVFMVEASEDCTLDILLAACARQTGWTRGDLILTHDNHTLVKENKTLASMGVVDGDIIVMKRIVQRAQQSLALPAKSTRQEASSSAAPARQGASTSRGGDDPAWIRQLFLSNPEQLAILKQNNPRLEAALRSNDLDLFTKVLQDQIRARDDRERQQIKLMNSSPYDAEAQRLIAEQIRQKNIEANMEAAIEYNPETFGSVVMLYINCLVNNYPVKAFVDSGAQTTIMSAPCAERCHIMRLVDTRWAGVAKGVGIQKILGRIHMVQIQIERDFLTTSFSILEQQPMDMLLGLDMLKRHQCTIDLRHDVLRIGTTGTTTPFLPENELPACARLTSTSSEEIVEPPSRPQRSGSGNSRRSR